MNILVTGAKGMVGTALCNNLKNIRDGKNKTRPALDIKEIYEYDLDSTPAELDEYCQKADFVFNLAGVNRPENPEDFMKGNFGFASDLLNCLKKHNNKATIMLSSSIQATLAGRFGNSEYGRSKKAGEELFFQYAQETGAKVAVYRFVNLMGHSRPKSLLLRPRDPQGHAGRDCRLAAGVQSTTHHPDDAENAGRLFCQEAVLLVFDLSAHRQV